MASYNLAYLVAKAGKPIITAKHLFPAHIDMVEIMVSKKGVNILKYSPLSDHTIVVRGNDTNATKEAEISKTIERYAPTPIQRLISAYRASVHCRPSS